MKYWIERNLKTQTSLANKSIKETEKQLTKYYKRAMNGAIKDFEATYDKLLLTVGEGKEVSPANLYRLDKYWQLQGELKHILQVLGDKQVEVLSKQFAMTYMSIYNALAIPGEVSFNSADLVVAQQIINQIWCADGKSWSNRIWKNTDMLQQALNDSLIECVVSGKKTTELKQMLMREFDVSYSRADALVRTEIAHIQTQASKDRYTNYGIQEVEIWADEDERRCDICGNLHQKRYPIGAVVPIPAHPRCRCCIVPVVETE